MTSGDDPGNPTLSTPRLLLRRPCADDLPRFVTLFAPLAVVRHTLTFPHPYTIDDGRAFLERTAAAQEKGESFNFCILLRDDAASAPVVVGSIGLMVSATHRHAELGYTLGQDYWGRGIATEAARAVVSFGFALGLERIHAGCATTNPGSVRVLEKLGFVREGLRERMYYRFGEWMDLALYRMFREDWPAAPDARAVRSG
ncbi:MAG: GNAT family N-acetyltransferase [Planctomycetota bacterium]|nr:GNAT family N-acetyltransferase [Planctomycetota bacterium]